MAGSEARRRSSKSASANGKADAAKARRRPPRGQADNGVAADSSLRATLKLVLMSVTVVCLSYAAFDYLVPSKSQPSKPARKALEHSGLYQAPREAALAGQLPPQRPFPSEPIRAADIARQASVLDAFVHSWSAYKRDAWGYDEYHPLSRTGSNLSGRSGNGMGYTIVDSLDTLILMGFKDDYEAARDWVRDELSWNVPGRMNVFETTIRTLGGLLSASALIRDPPNPIIPASEQDAEMFLAKAAALAERLVPAFNTKTGVPLREVDLETGEAFGDADNRNASSLAEATTLQLEFKYLAHLLDDKFYWKLAEKPMHVVRRASQQMMQYGSLLPIFLDPQNGRFYNSDVRLGSRGDSYYEYLVKQWVQTNRTEQVYKDMYDSAVYAIKTILIKTSVKSQPPLLFTTELTPRPGPMGKTVMRLSPKQDHLVCFLGGAMMLGAVSLAPLADGKGPSSDLRLLPPGAQGAKGDVVEVEDWRLGHELIRTCMATYQGTKTGLAPEIAFFRAPQEAMMDEDWYIKKPPPSFEGKANPLIDARNILRPETVESLFIAFHLTGDEVYRDWGWEIFEAFVKHCKVESGGFASIDDVDAEEPQQMDRMETFWLSETLKYLYLLFSDQSLLPLDQWVLNTEAHPLPIFEPQFVTTVE